MVPGRPNQRWTHRVGDGDSEGAGCRRSGWDSDRAGCPTGCGAERRPEPALVLGGTWLGQSVSTQPVLLQSMSFHLTVEPLGVIPPCPSTEKARRKVGPKAVLSPYPLASHRSSAGACVVAVSLIEGTSGGELIPALPLACLVTLGELQCCLCFPFSAGPWVFWIETQTPGVSAPPREDKDVCGPWGGLRDSPLACCRPQDAHGSEGRRNATGWWEPVHSPLADQEVGV